MQRRWWRICIANESGYLDNAEVSLNGITIWKSEHGMDTRREDQICTNTTILDT